MKKIILLSIAMSILTGCVAMREKGTVNIPQYKSSKPPVTLTASFTNYKNGERQAFLNDRVKKDLLKTAEEKAEQTGLFGPISSTADLHVHCDLTLKTKRDWNDFWMSFVTLQIYPDRQTLEYTLRTKATDRKTGKTYTAASQDILTVYSSIWILPVAPFRPAFKEGRDMEQYLFSDTINQLAQKGLFSDALPD